MILVVKLIVIKEKVSRLMPFLVISIIISTAIVIGIIASREFAVENPQVVLGIIAFLGLIDAIIVRILLRQRHINRMLTKLESLIMLNGSKIKLPYTMRLERGEAEIVGYWIRSGRSSSYYHKCGFKPLSGLQYLEYIDLNDVPSTFTVLVEYDGTGAIKVPAFRINDPEFKDVIFLVFNLNNLKLSMESSSISVATTNDVAEATIEVRNNIMRGTISRPIIGKARGARLELHGSVKVYGRTFTIRKVLANVRERTITFEERPAPEESIVIVTHKNICSPLKVIRSLNWRRPVMFGFSDGEYKLRLVLDMPFRRDVYREIPFKPLKSSF